jgi:putative transposase
MKPTTTKESTMTESMIDLPGIIAKSDDGDFLRDLIQDAAQRLMDIEVAAVCGAGHGERSPDRENQRNGYRPRQWDTRAGTIGLSIPKLRKGVPAAPSRPSSNRAGRPRRR